MKLAELPSGCHFFGDRNQPLVVLLHSSQSNSGQWRQLIASLQAQYAVLAIDLIGYGKAPALSAVTKQPTTFRFDDETPRIVTAIQSLAPSGTITLIGHSYGAALALKLALEQPFKVDRLLMFEPVAFHVLPHQHAARDEIEAVAEQMLNAPAEEATQGFVDYWNQPGYFQALPEKIRNAMIAQAPKVNADFAALMGEPHQLEDYQRVSQPCLLLQGKQTRLSAKQVAQQLLRVLPNATTEKLDCGHMGPLTHPQMVNAAIIEFLQNK